MNRALDAAVCGDARAALDAIPDAGAVRTGWLERVRELRTASAARLEVAGADAAVFFRALREVQVPDEPDPEFLMRVTAAELNSLQA